MSLSVTSSTYLPFGLDNSATSYAAILCQKDLTRTQFAPQFDSYLDSDDDFDPDSNFLNYLSLTILTTPQSRVVY